MAATALSQIGITATFETINYIFNLCDSGWQWSNYFVLNFKKTYHEMIKES